MKAFLKNITYILILVSVSLVFCSNGSNRVLVNLQTAPLEGRGEINIHYIADYITIYESDTHELVLKEYMSKSEQGLYAKISSDDRTLNIEGGGRPWFSFIKAEIEIYIPKNYQGKLNITTVSGEVRSRMDLEIKELNISSASGSITLQSARTEKLLLKSKSGSIHIQRAISKSINIESTSGKISIEKARGELNLKTVSSKINVKEIDGSGSFQSASGKINVCFTHVTNDIFAKTTSGKVLLTIPEDWSFFFKASTRSGVIKTNFIDNGDTNFKSVSQQIGDSPKINVEISTSSGGIEIVSKPAINKEVINKPHIL
ncbi:DUF4097 domain-containing protein [Paludibacteraceae bacterium OttesenSCG-928-F17]|nr:DUF4097 domain-containing protein [Paludibacteraceae bacterium OttesenSCG-928-F17]